MEPEPSPALSDRMGHDPRLIARRIVCGFAAFSVCIGAGCSPGTAEAPPSAVASSSLEPNPSVSAASNSHPAPSVDDETLVAFVDEVRRFFADEIVDTEVTNGTIVVYAQGDVARMREYVAGQDFAQYVQVRPLLVDMETLEHWRVVVQVALQDADFPSVVSYDPGDGTLIVYSDDPDAAEEVIANIALDVPAEIGLRFERGGRVIDQ